MIVLLSLAFITIVAALLLCSVLPHCCPVCRSRGASIHSEWDGQTLIVCRQCGHAWYEEY